MKYYINYFINLTSFVRDAVDIVNWDGLGEFIGICLVIINKISIYKNSSSSRIN